MSGRDSITYSRPSLSGRDSITGRESLTSRKSRGLSRDHAQNDPRLSLVIDDASHSLTETVTRDGKFVETSPMHVASVDPEADIPFEFSHGISEEEAQKRLQIYGRNELPEKVIPKWYIFVSQLWQPMPVMIWIAAIIEAAISNFEDMGILLFIQFANASIGYYEITKAGDAVAALKSQLQAKATVKRDGKTRVIEAALLVPGDLVLLGAGAAVPADCRVNEGQIECDQAALTGESLPVTLYQGDAALMGSTVVRGEEDGTVEFTGANTFFGKTAALLKVRIQNLIEMMTINFLICRSILQYLHPAND